VFADNATIARATPRLATWARVEDVADDVLEAMFHGRVDRETGLAQLLEVTAPLLTGSG
jgi:multiple sugar transport system substrate-binding protein